MTALSPSEPTASAAASAAASATGTAAGTATCPRCGAERIAGATFCEECAFEFADGPTVPIVPAAEAPGEESPLDVGWTGPVIGASAIAADTPTDTVAGLGSGPVPAREVCRECGQGDYEDGYCNQCGAKQPDPRSHFGEAPAPWVAGVCDIGRRHRRNEDAMALHAEPSPLSFAALVVCDGVSNSTDSHIASLAASRAARDVLRQPMPRGAGTRSALVAAAEQRLDDAARAAQQAVVETTATAGEAAVASPPSCTLVAALVVGGTAVAGNVGDSRCYWLPDAPGSAARQLGADDSFAAAQMSSGVSRKDAESGTGAHAITRWLGVDSPEDLTPNTGDVDLTEDGWLVVCSDGLWNYWSDADDLRALVQESVAALGDAGRHPPTLAQALTDRANQAGGADNITVALVRVGAVADQPPAAPPRADQPPAAPPRADQPLAAPPRADPTPAEPDAFPETSEGVHAPDDLGAGAHHGPEPTHTDASPDTKGSP